MTNTILKMAMFNHYNKTSAAHLYIIGFNYKGNIYMVKVTADILKALVWIEKSGKDGYALKFKVNNSERLYLLTLGARVLCSTDYFNHLVKTTRYNKGETYERLVTEYYNQEWHKDNIDYRVQGDITINGTEIQVKYEKATFITEGQVRRQRRERPWKVSFFHIWRGKKK